MYKANDGGEAPSHEDIDRLIHEPARLLIMASLYVVDRADFIFLMRQTGLTWGNLSGHMSKLEAAGYIEVIKDFIDKKPHTTLRLTEKGKDAFRVYRKSMKQVLDDLPP
ncbi:MAG TPA: transcriptional regulator [Methanocella sp.]|uniref:winged helix-turn-helix domain-containing protein n=1 Tax=Methanocella sp. TaxID=2052833 RepID=UPI002CCDAAEA|nr:transcriptional regulator [Methanocella sp.]HTY91446.1 transcriptional regulator [Methanocella sp.]